MALNTADTRLCRESVFVERRIMSLPMLPCYGIAELDDNLFYPVELKLLSPGYLFAVPLVEAEEYLRYLSAAQAQQRCQEIREWGAFWKQSQWETEPYFPDWEDADVCFIEAITGQRLNVSLSGSAGSVRAWLSGYSCSHGTYHMVTDGQGETRSEAVSQLADHVYEVNLQCLHLCGGPSYLMSQGLNLLYPIAKRSCLPGFRVWLQLIMLLASLILVSGGFGYAFWQMHHFT